MGICAGEAIDVEAIDVESIDVEPAAGQDFFLICAGEAIDVEAKDVAPCAHPMRTQGVGCRDMCR